MTHASLYDPTGKPSLRDSDGNVHEFYCGVDLSGVDRQSYPETGWGTEYNVDMCPDCFKDKLIPWLESQGCTTERKDWDW